MSKRILWFLPAAFLIGTVLVYPAIRTFVLSFFRMDLGTSFHAEFAGISNFVRLVLDSRFRSSLWMTILFTTATVTIEFAAGLILALSVDNWVRARTAVRSEASRVGKRAILRDVWSEFE